MGPVFAILHLSYLHFESSHSPQPESFDFSLIWIMPSNYSFRICLVLSMNWSNNYFIFQAVSDRCRVLILEFLVVLYCSLITCLHQLKYPYQQTTFSVYRVRLQPIAIPLRTLVGWGEMCRLVGRVPYSTWIPSWGRPIHCTGCFPVSIHLYTECQFNVRFR